MLLEEALGQFIEWGMTKYALNTVRTYSDLIGRFIAFAGNKDVREVEITDVTAYYKHLKQKGYAESSIAYMMISIRGLMRFLFLRRLVAWDYELIGIPKYAAKSYSPIEETEAEQMIESIRKNTFKNLRDKTILAFLYASGLRVSELCDLKLGDLFLKARYGQIVSKKNRLGRMILWNEKAHNLLIEYLRSRELWNRSEYVFISLDRKNFGGRLSTRSIQRLVERYRPRVGISPHSFRHGLGMRAVKSGIHNRYIQKILGHKNINSSQIYMDTHDEDVVREYAKIDRKS